MVGDVSIAELPAMSVMVIVCVLALPCAVKSNGLGGLEEATPESESLGKKMTEPSVLFTLTDIAGNSATFTSPAFNIDKTVPTAIFAPPNPAPNSAGWNKTDVS